jgi:bis(5'-adenosyl)-triphosphatase
VLVIPRRIVPRYAQLDPDELADMSLSVQTIGAVVEREFKCTSLTIACQDGPQACVPFFP